MSNVLWRTARASPALFQISGFQLFLSSNYMTIWHQHIFICVHSDHFNGFTFPFKILLSITWPWNYKGVSIYRLPLNINSPNVTVTVTVWFNIYLNKISLIFLPTISEKYITNIKKDIFWKHREAFSIDFKQWRIVFRVSLFFGVV